MRAPKWLEIFAGEAFGETLVRAIELARNTIDTIRQWFDENGPAIEAALGTIRKVFQDTFGAVVGAFQEAWPELQAAFETIKEAFASLDISF